MSELRFHVNLGPDGMIRPPEGTAMPRENVEVTVRTTEPPAPSESDRLAPTRAWLLQMAETAEATAPPLPPLSREPVCVEVIARTDFSET